MLAAISGAQMNRAVSPVAVLRHDRPWNAAAAFALVQLVAGILGVWAAHLMFGMPSWSCRRGRAPASASGRPSLSPPSV